jgi:hypothetical protein
MLETKDRVRDMQLEHLMTKSKIGDLIEQNERLATEMAILKQILDVHNDAVRNTTGSKSLKGYKSTIE